MNLIRKFLSYLPTRLPVGLQEFDKWASDIRALVGPGFEQVPEDDFKFVLANNIIHLGPQRCSAPKNFFVRTIRKGAANQIASQVFQDVKTRHNAAVKAEQQPAPTPAAQPTEATTPGAADGEAKIQASN